VRLLSKYHLIILCVISSAGCASSRVADSIAGILPAGYEAMDLPRSSIPIGARWRQGVGPDGVGVPESELERVESAANISSTSEFAQEVQIAVTGYLGMDSKFTRSASVELSGLTIERLASLDKVSVGVPVLYEGLKAARITIKYDAEFDASLKANASVKNLPIVLSSDTDARRSLTLDGSNLYLAYRVVELKNGSVRRWRRSQFSSRNLKGYEVRLDTRNIQSCMCSAGDWESAERCAAEVPAIVQVVNYARVRSDGSPYERAFDLFGQAVPGGKGLYLRQGPPPGRFPLGTMNSGERVTSDILVVGAKFTAVAVHGCMLVPQYELELVRSKFRLRSFKSPSAPGW
jgi:hypothetical protein